MSSSWYYEFHHKGTFPQQQKLCDRVRWSRFNLEGQHIRSQGVLSAIHGNPLTIRLLSLDYSMNYLFELRAIDKSIQNQVNCHLHEHRSVALSGTWEAETSSSRTDGAPIEKVEIGNTTFEIRHVDIQFSLYNFFTNFCSILDRIALEIVRIYELGIPVKQIDWTNISTKYLSKLESLDKDLSELIIVNRQEFNIATRYRNRLIHDGIIHFDVNINHKGVAIALNEDPDNEFSSFSTNAIDFCELNRDLLLTFLNNCYSFMLNHVNLIFKEEPHA